MKVSVGWLVGFFAVYVLFKGFLFWRLNIALKQMEAKQKALANLPSFDATRRGPTAPGQPGPGGTGVSPLSEL
ncbi:MAG: hypothetical protein ACM3RP_06720 [Chitinophagales bacterium]